MPLSRNRHRVPKTDIHSHSTTERLYNPMNDSRIKTTPLTFPVLNLDAGPEGPFQKRFAELIYAPANAARRTYCTSHVLRRVNLLPHYTQKSSRQKNKNNLKILASAGIFPPPAASEPRPGISFGRRCGGVCVCVCVCVCV